MPFIPAIDVIKLVPEFTLPDNQVAVNTLYFATQPDQASSTALADASLK